MLAIISFFLFAITVNTVLAEVIYVDAGAAARLPCGGRSTPCSSLEDAIRNTVNSSISIQILSETLMFWNRITIENTTRFKLKGMDSGGTLITCLSHQDKQQLTPGDQLPGLVLVEVTSTEIENINITGCGTVREYVIAMEDRYDYLAAIHLHRCKDVEICEVSFTGNCGSGLAIVEPHTGMVSISNSTFSSNSVPGRYRSEYDGGAGLFVRVSGEWSPQFSVSHCLFEHNRATATFVFTFLTVFNQPHNGTGRGGGADIVIWRASQTNIVISNCTFRNNSAYLGGGLAIQINDDSHHNRILIQDGRFDHNGCLEGSRSGSGGGVHIGYGYENNYAINNTFHIEQCTFRENCADLGGGMTYFAARFNRMEHSQSNVIVLDGCDWNGNMAYIGAAVDISPHSNSRTRSGFLPAVVFKECSFVRNTIIFRQLEFKQSFGLGVVFSSLMNVDFVSNVIFQYNKGSALVIVNAIANFSESDAVFVGNAGVQGGAIALTGISALLIGPGKQYNFTENHATHRGGAIYNYLIDNHDFTVSETCFIYYIGNNTPVSQWNTSFYFINNSAGEYGHSIFSSSLLACMGDEDDNISMVFRWPHVFNFDIRRENQIVTEASSFSVSTSIPFLIIPGEQHKLHIEIADENGQEIDTIFRASMLDTTNKNVQVDDAFSCVSGNVIQMTGKSNNFGVLLLETISSRKSSIAVNVSLLPCPPGFDLVNHTCTCSINTYSGIVGCDSSSFQSHIKVGYWAGYINDKFVTGICPLAFCSYNESGPKREVILPRNSSPTSLDEFICGQARTGVLCGSCKPGYSVYYHSPSYECHPSKYCRWGWAFYILSEIIPVTVVFVVVLAVNISFTSGYLNGFILFSQLVDSVIVNGSGVVQYPRALSILSWGYQLIYGVFSMEFFNIEPLSFCLWKGASVLDVLAFRYVTFVYAFLLVLVTLLFLTYCGHIFARKRKHLRITTFKTSIIHGLSAFIILCYSQTTKTSIYILVYGTVKGKYGYKESLRVFLNGDTELYGIEHIPYAIPALLCLITISTIPPALLLFYPSIYRLLALCKVSDKAIVLRATRMIPIHKLRPFLDSFQSCFRDNLRFFAGVYFVYRWIGLFLFALVPTITGFYISLGAIYIILLMIHAVFQPYTSKVNNIIDGCLFTNLALIYIIAAYNYLLSQGCIEIYSTQATYISTMASIQLILIYTPIIAMILYLAFLLYQTLKCKRKATSSPAFSSYINEPQKTRVSSSDINDLISGPEEFPPRMLETDYDEYSNDLACSSATTFSSSSQLVETYL